MNSLKIKKRYYDNTLALAICTFLFVSFCFFAYVRVIYKNNQNAQKVKVYCENLFEENREKGCFNEKDIETLKRHIRAEYGLGSNITANFIEDKENMFLSVEVYDTDLEGKKVFSRSYFFDKNSK